VLLALRRGHFRLRLLLRKTKTTGEVNRIMSNRMYNWLHLPTSTKGESRFEDLLSDSQAIRRVNEMNSQQPGVWFYWI